MVNWVIKKKNFMYDFFHVKNGQFILKIKMFLTPFEIIYNMDRWKNDNS